jgi:hypothetical protein
MNLGLQAMADVFGEKGVGARHNPADEVPGGGV